MASIGPPALGAKGCVERLRRFAQGATAVEGAFKFIEGASLYKTIQPPCGRGNASPFGALRHHLPPAKRWDNKAPLCCERLMKGMLRGVLFCPLNRAMLLS